MKNVNIICDRCGKIVHGLISEDGITSGFYDVSTEEWKEFRKWKWFNMESRICDNCMMTSKKYQKVYGYVNT
jgi:hypothetical protein